MFGFQVAIQTSVSCRELNDVNPRASPFQNQPPSERHLTKQMGVVRIGSAVIRPRGLGPAETTDAENEKDRECGENEDAGENVGELKDFKHGQPPGMAVLIKGERLCVPSFFKRSYLEGKRQGEQEPSGDALKM